MAKSFSFTTSSFDNRATDSPASKSLSKPGKEETLVNFLILRNFGGTIDLQKIAELGQLLLIFRPRKKFFLNKKKKKHTSLEHSKLQYVTSKESRNNFKILAFKFSITVFAFDFFTVSIEKLTNKDKQELAS